MTRFHHRTTRRRTHKLPSETERGCTSLLDVMIRSTLEGFLIVDLSGRIVEANEVYCALIGYSRNELFQMHISELEEMEQPEEVSRRMRRIVRNGSDRFQTRHRCRDGSILEVEISVTFLPDHGGRFYGFVKDVTDRHRLEKELSASEQRFRLFVENANDVFFALAPNGIFSYVSPKWKEAFGYELDETIGQPFAPFVHPDDVQACFSFLQLVLETGQKQSGVEYRVLCKDGTYVWYTANGSLINDPVDNTVTFIGIGRDITQQKQAEQTLRQSEEKFSAAFHASPDAITLSCLSDGTFCEVNQGFTLLTGYTPEEVIGRCSEDLDLWVDLQERSRFMHEIAHNGLVTCLESQFWRKDGSMLTGQVSARLIEIDGQQYILSIMRDTTEHEYIQKELVKAQKLESISILAGGIAHNFNNVLTGVIGYISYAKKHIGEKEKCLQILSAAERASFRAAGLARQLLTFSQGGDPIRRPVPVEKLVQESVSLFLSGTNVKGVIECSSDLTVHIDREQMDQAFNNLVLNAVHAMPDGGTLTVSIDSVRLRNGNVHGLPSGQYVRIAFKDTGCGIEKKNLLKVFDPYFTTKESGTGLGLSTTHSIVKKHGGNIDITSEVGGGTVATILLPSSEESCPDDLDGGTQPAPTHLKGAVLVMDDEDVVRDLATNMLGDLGYKVITCTTGEEAIALYQSSQQKGEPFRMALIDLVIPGGMSGEEAAQRILELDPQARLIASSGYSGSHVMAEYAKYGFCSALPKPYNVDQLAQALLNVS